MPLSKTLEAYYLLKAFREWLLWKQQIGDRLSLLELLREYFKFRKKMMEATREDARRQYMHSMASYARGIRNWLLDFFDPFDTELLKEVARKQIDSGAGRIFVEMFFSFYLPILRSVRYERYDDEEYREWTKDPEEKKRWAEKAERDFLKFLREQGEEGYILYQYALNEMERPSSYPIDTYTPFIDLLNLEREGDLLNPYKYLIPAVEKIISEAHFGSPFLPHIADADPYSILGAIYAGGEEDARLRIGEFAEPYLDKANLSWEYIQDAIQGIRRIFDENNVSVPNEVRRIDGYLDSLLRIHADIFEGFHASRMGWHEWEERIRDARYTVNNLDSARIFLDEQQKDVEGISEEILSLTDGLEEEIIENIEGESQTELLYEVRRIREHTEEMKTFLLNAINILKGIIDKIETELGVLSGASRSGGR